VHFGRERLRIRQFQRRKKLALARCARAAEQLGFTASAAAPVEEEEEEEEKRNNGSAVPDAGIRGDVADGEGAGLT
jgi:hypothetical protein